MVDYQGVLKDLIVTTIVISLFTFGIPFLIESFTSNPDFSWDSVSNGDGGTLDMSIVPRIMIMLTVFLALISVVRRFKFDSK